MRSLLLLILGLCGCQHPPAVGKRVDPLLKPPLTLVELHHWRDGGSLGLMLRDSTGKELSFCVDGRIASPTPGRWYIGATHPGKEHASLVESDSGLERSLEETLRAWVSQHYDEAQQRQLVQSPVSEDEDSTRRDARTILKCLGPRKASYPADAVDRAGG